MPGRSSAVVEGGKGTHSVFTEKKSRPDRPNRPPLTTKDTEFIAG